MVRPFNHAGPRQSPRYVLAGLALQVAEVENGRRECLEVGNLDVVRDFIDVATWFGPIGFSATRRQAGEIYNLGSGQGTRSPTHSIICVAGEEAIPVRVDAAGPRRRPAPAGRRYLQATRRHRLETGFTIEQTLTDMLDFCRNVTGVNIAGNLKSQGAMSMLPEITETILRAKSARGLTFAALAEGRLQPSFWRRPVTARRVQPGTGRQAARCPGVGPCPDGPV